MERWGTPLGVPPWVASDTARTGLPGSQGQVLLTLLFDVALSTEMDAQKLA